MYYKIRKELKELIKQEKKKIPNITMAQERNLVNKCRGIINSKYRHSWRNDRRNHLKSVN